MPVVLELGCMAAMRCSYDHRPRFYWERFVHISSGFDIVLGLIGHSLYWHEVIGIGFNVGGLWPSCPDLIRRRVVYGTNKMSWFRKWHQHEEDELVVYCNCTIAVKGQFIFLFYYVSIVPGSTFFPSILAYCLAVPKHPATYQSNPHMLFVTVRWRRKNYSEN